MNYYILIVIMLVISGITGCEKKVAGNEASSEKYFRDCSNCPEMVNIPAGVFIMGSPESEKARLDAEGPQHEVSINAYAIGKYPITFEEWDICEKEKGCHKRPTDYGNGRGTRPVEGLTWPDTQEYVRWLSMKTGKKYRLPSEAEWEYSARAGTTTARFWGEELGVGNANCNGCGSKWDNLPTRPVGSFQPNPFGLFDTLGNVWQFTNDCWNDDYTGAPNDGSAWTTGKCSVGHVARGGSFRFNPDDMRAARRTACGTCGFRVVRERL